jgi:hypothetical protein
MRTALRLARMPHSTTGKGSRRSFETELETSRTVHRNDHWPRGGISAAPDMRGRGSAVHRPRPRAGEAGSHTSERKAQRRPAPRQRRASARSGRSGTEKEGFEPSRQGFSPPNALAGRRLQPLGHFSGPAQDTAGLRRRPRREYPFGGTPRRTGAHTMTCAGSPSLRHLRCPSAATRGGLRPLKGLATRRAASRPSRAACGPGSRSRRRRCPCRA